MGLHREPSDRRSAALRDLLWVLLAVAVFVVPGSLTGLFGRAYAWVDERFEGHLGNAMAGLLLLCIGLAVFGLLQWRSARREFRARRDAESRFRTLVERVPAVTYAWDSSKHVGEAAVAYMSPQIEALLGYPADEFQRDPRLWSSLVHPHDLDRVQRDWETADERDGTILSEYRMRTRDGREVWVRDEAVPFSRDDRNPMLQGVMFDITERKHAEERLLEAEERFRSLVEQVPAITYIAELDGGYRYISPQIEAILGYTAQEWVADPSLWEQALHVEDRERVLSEDRTDAGDVWSSIHRMVGRDGRVVWVQNHAVLLRGVDGRPRYWQGVVFDITELKTAEVRIAEAETNYRTLVEQLPVVVYRDAIDDLSTAIYISPQYEQLFGFPAEARMRDPGFWVNHLHPDDRDRIVALSRWTNETGEPFSAEYRFLAREGRVVWVRDEAVLLRDGDGEPLLWQGVLFDITARKHAEEALARRDAVLEAIGFAAERFLKSHDWSSTLPAVLERIGIAAGAHRAYVFENASLEDGRLAMWLRREWRAPDVASTIDVPANQGFAYADGFIRWQAVLSRGTELHGLTRDFPEAEQAALLAEGVRSQIVAPVFVGDAWWGYLGFDDCDAERIWAPAEVEAIKAAADTLGAAIGRAKAEHERVTAQTAAAQLEARTSAVLASALEGIVTMDEEGRIVDLNAAGERMFGHRLEDVAGRQLAEILIPPEYRARHSAALARYLETGEGTILGRNLEVEALRANGDRFPIELTVTRVEMPGSPMFTGFIRDLTERKLAERQLRETEERYRTLIENLPAATYIDEVDELSTTLFVTPQIESIWGYTPQEWIAEPDLWFDALHPDDREAVLAALERHNRSGEPFEIDYRFRAKDGRWTWVSDHATVVRNAEGAIAFSQGVMFDVTERRQAEDRLRDAEERYRALVEAAPAVVYRMGMDETWPLLFVSPSAAAVFGEHPEWWTDPPRSWRAFIHPEDLESVDRNTRRAVGSGEAFGMEYRVVRPDGDTKWIFDNAIQIKDEKGEPRYWQGIFVDLSTQKELEEARRESEEQLRDAEQRYRAIVEHVPAAIYVDVPDGSMATSYVSPQIEQIMGCTPQEFMADPNLWLERMPDEQQRSDIRESYLRAIAERRSWTGEYWIRHPDGREVWVHDETTFVTDEDGEPLFLQGVMYDMTERKLAQQALEASERRERDAAERLRTLDEMKNTFLAAVSHELRSPLTSILGLTLTLERHRFPEDERADLLGRLASNARKLDRLLKDLLDIDRLSRGIVTPNVRPTDLAAIVDRTIESLDVLGERSILVQTEQVVIPVDPPKIERIVENLVMNAVRHTEPDVGIWVRVWPEEAGAVIAVEDDGPGVPGDLRSEIFEPFRQGPMSASSHAPGTGIGLSLVAMFADLHGGRAWVQDREGGGASFRVFLPATGHGEPADAGWDADEAAPIGTRTPG